MFSIRTLAANCDLGTVGRLRTVVFFFYDAKVATFPSTFVEGVPIRRKEKDKLLPGLL